MKRRITLVCPGCDSAISGMTAQFDDSPGALAPGPYSQHCLCGQTVWVLFSYSGNSIDITLTDADPASIAAKPLIDIRVPRSGTIQATTPPPPLSNPYAVVNIPTDKPIYSKVLKFGKHEYEIGTCRNCAREDTLLSDFENKRVDMKRMCLSCIDAGIKDAQLAQTQLVAAKAGGRYEEKRNDKREMYASALAALAKAGIP